MLKKWLSTPTTTKLWQVSSSVKFRPLPFSHLRVAEPSSIFFPFCFLFTFILFLRFFFLFSFSFSFYTLPQGHFWEFRWLEVTAIHVTDIPSKKIKKLNIWANMSKFGSLWESHATFLEFYMVKHRVQHMWLRFLLKR
jgi:hypothetical protein